MSTYNVDSVLVERPTVVGANSQGYSRKKVLMPNVTTPASDAVAAINITNAGTNYTGVPTIALTGGGGTGATATSRMKVLTATAVAAGALYQPGNTITLAGGTSTTAAVLTIDAVKLVSCTIDNAGTGYAVNDVIELAGGTSTGSAAITVTTVGGSGEITGFIVSEGGSYTVTAASLTQAFTTGSGTGAVVGGTVWGVATTTPTTAGVYSALPSNPAAQASTSGSGSGATFNLTWGVHSAVVTAGGQDYTSAPTVTFSGGGGSGAAATAVVGAVGDPVTVNIELSDELPTATYTVDATPDQASAVSYGNKTTTSFDLTLTPVDGGTLVAGTADVVIEFTS